MGCEIYAPATIPEREDPCVTHFTCDRVGPTVNPTFSLVKGSVVHAEIRRCYSVTLPFATASHS